MNIEWSAIDAAHVQQAFEAIAARPRVQGRHTGLVVYSGETCLPAKEVLREAYRIAKHLPSEAAVNFASGEATLGKLRKLGFRAERLTARAKHIKQS